MGANADLVKLMGPELELLLPVLDEKARRLALGAVARAAGDGGVTAVAKMTGASWQTVADGAAEPGSGQVAAEGRIRRPGGGRKKLAGAGPGLVPALLALVEDCARGDPESPLAWTARSVMRLSDELTAAGHRCSPQTAWRLRHEQGFSAQADAKVMEGRRHPDRDARFRYIAAQAKEQPGTSKWNKIGHRLFSQITIAGRGRPLTSHDVIIDTIAAVTTRTGLTVTAVLDGARYPTGTQISDELMQDLEDRALTRHGFHGEWNYTLLPALRPAPEPQPEPAPPPAAAARAAVLPALASPELTGLCRQDLAALAASPELPWAAAREQRLHPERGHSRRARTGPAAPFRYTLETRLPAAICHHRPGMPCSHIAALPGARHGTITPAVQAITNLPGSGHPALAPGPVRVRTPTDLRRHAAAAGITIPDPPPRGRLRK